MVLALVLSGCGFSGALYLPGESPPSTQEQPPTGEQTVPEAAGEQSEAPPL